MRIKKALVRLLCCMIPVAKYRRNLRRWFLVTRKQTAKLFAAQYDDNGFFQAYDTCVRYAFAREFLSGNKNGFWYDMYIKMQTKRGTIYDHDIARFSSLIESYKTNGYSRQAIELYKDGLTLADGSHRLALNLLFRYRWTYYACNNIERKYRNYGLDWFRNNGFTRSEISALLEIKEQIFKKYKLKKQMD